ncbi:MAG: hypothetical protein JWR27_1833 [Aeromicrobium sp.]|jgi:hypothetical protein|nr:hypothetical protein [Aeromicrobium sp.]
MTTSPTHGTHGSPARSATAYGLVSFAAAMLLITAVFQLLEGIAAVAKDEVYATGVDYAYKLDVTAWGWIHIVVGALGLATALAILTGQVWGHVIGIGIAAVSAILSFAFLPYYPLWTLVVIAFDVLVIWALFNQISSDARR